MKAEFITNIQKTDLAYMIIVPYVYCFVHLTNDNRPHSTLLPISLSKNTKVHQH